MVLDNLVRGRRANLDRAIANGPVRLVEGDIRDAALVHELTAGADLVFHLAAIRITQCAEEPRLANEVLVDGTFNVLEAARGAGREARWSPRRRRRCTGWPSSSRPASATTRTTTTPSTVPRRPSTRACCAASTPCTGSTTWLCATSTCTGPRMDVHGLYTEVLIRWMERIESGVAPLILGDGLQTMDFVDVRGHRAGEHSRRRGRRHRRRSSTSPAARRPACSTSPPR